MTLLKETNLGPTLGIDYPENIRSLQFSVDPYYEYDSPCYSNYYGHCHGSKSGQYETWRHTWNALDIVAYSIGYAAFLCVS